MQQTIKAEVFQAVECPSCKTISRVDKDKNTVSCTGCGVNIEREYPVTRFFCPPKEEIVLPHYRR